MSFEVMVEVGLATICFLGNCYPALIGAETPKGEFQLQLYKTTLPNYGGDILVFKEQGNDVYAIHRVIDVPGQRRLERLQSKNPKERQMVTLGCINVDQTVYSLLVECCYDSKLIIK